MTFFLIQKHLGLVGNLAISKSAKNVTLHSAPGWHPSRVATSFATWRPELRFSPGPRQVTLRLADYLELLR
jgi:hypothetical protein